MLSDDLVAVRFETASTGTGDVVAGAAPVGCRLPPAALDGEEVSYEIAQVDAGAVIARENGRAVWNHGTQTLLRSAGSVVFPVAGAVAFDGTGTRWVTFLGLPGDFAELEALGTMALYSAGPQFSPGDADVVYSRATHGDFPAFWYRDPPLSVGRTLRFDMAEGVTGSLCLIRVRAEAVNELTVEVENADAPGSYVQLPVPPGHTRLVRKHQTGGWWTDFGFWENGAQVNHAFVGQADAEAGVLSQARSWSPERVKQAIVALALQEADLLAANQGAAGFTQAPKFWKGTAAEYDALVKDNDTVYFVTT